MVGTADISVVWGMSTLFGVPVTMDQETWAAMDVDGQQMVVLEIIQNCLSRYYKSLIEAAVAAEAAREVG